MAARPLQPPELTNQDHNLQGSNVQQEQHILEQENLNFENVNLDLNQRQENRKSINSPCSKIKVMHLFHEMKQKFPTVPDHVVNQCVWDNCEDRNKCIELLEVELELHPTTAQIYPSQAIRGVSGDRRNSNELSQQHIKNISDIHYSNSPSSSNSSDYKNLLKPTRPAPVPKPFINCDTVNSVVNLKPLDNQDCLELLKKCQNLSIASNNESPTNVNSSVINDQLISNRPTTLNLNGPPKNQTSVRLSQQKVKQNHKGLRPVRRAPPPPVGGNSQNFTTQLQGSHQNIDQILSPLSDSGESEFSINISLSSPASDCSKKSIIPQQQQPPPRRKISSLSIQPEPAYTRDFCSNNSPVTPQNPRSFTSLNLTLRQPSTTPQSPIDITAGPGLTYSSSSYDAKQGYQKQFLITVNDKGGVFSASQIKRPRSCLASQQHHNEEEFPGDNNLMRQATSEQNVHDNTKNYTSSHSSRNTNFTMRLPKNENSQLIVEKQKQRRNKLKEAIEQHKKRLIQVQFEINVLNNPYNEDDLRLVKNDIQKLGLNCELLITEIENIKTRRTVNNSQSNRVQQNVHHKSIGHSPLQTTNPIMEITSTENDVLNEDGPQWACKYCTFLNDPLMVRCENCDYKRENSGINSFISTDNNLCVNNNNSLPNLNT